MDSFKKDPWKIGYVLFTGIILYLFYVRVRLIFSYSADLDGTEFIFAHVVQLFMQGKPLYPNPMEFPFSATLYTPAYSCLMRFLGGIFNCGPNDLHFILVIARTLSLLAMLVNVYFIFKLFKQFKLSCFYFFAGITFYLLLITGHFYVMRPDAVKTTLITIFIYTGFQYLFFSGRKVHLVFSVLSALTAVYFKQDAILNVYLLLVPACLYLRSGRAYLLVGFFTGCLIVSLGGCYAIFGKYFFVNTVLLNFQSLTDVKNSINVLIILFSVVRNVPLLLLGIYACYLSAKHINSKQAEHFIPFAALITFLVTHAGMLRVGSYLNYSFESILLLILSAAIVIRHYEPVLVKHTKALSALSIIYLVGLFSSNGIIHSYTFEGDKEAVWKEDYFSIMSARDSLTTLAQSGTVFFPNEKYTAFFPQMPMIFGHDFHRGRFIEIYHGLHAPSKLSFVSSEDYDAWFKDGRVQYIVVDDSEWSKIHVNKYYPQFHFDSMLNKFCIYKYQE